MPDESPKVDSRATIPKGIIEKNKQLLAKQQSLNSVFDEPKTIQAKMIDSGIYNPEVVHQNEQPKNLPHVRKNSDNIKTHDLSHPENIN